MLEYKISLIKVFWTPEGIDTRFFNSIDEQTQYFQQLTGGEFSPLVNFNMGNNIETSIVYKDTSSKSIEELVSSNYAVINKIIDNIVVDRRYFFAYVKQDSGRQLLVTLSLDDIQTNYFKYKNKISNCNILRSHLNRFIEEDNGSLSFDLNRNSKLFERENIGNFSKRLIRREKLNFKINQNLSENETFNSYIKDNIDYWVYVFLSNGKYVIDQDNNEVNFDGCKIYTNENGESITTPYSIICYPVYKTTKYMGIMRKVNLSEFSIISQESFEEFKILNQGIEDKIYSIKMSCLSPFNCESYFNTNEPIYDGKEYNYNNDSKNFEIITKIKNDLNKQYEFSNIGIFSLGDSQSSTTLGFGSIIYINNTKIYSNILEFLPYNVYKKINFTKEEIKNGSLGYITNPKLLGNDFFELVISDNNNSFSYDFQKINNNNVIFSYNEILTPDITRHYVKYKPTKNDEIYISQTQKNFTGLSSSQDNSIPYSKNQLDVFLSNNKNFYLQRNLQLGTSLLNLGLGSFGANLIGGKPIGNISKGGVSLISGGISLLSDRINSNLTLDNMKNSAESLQNANGNIIYNASVSDIGIYVEEYECLSHEIQIANDYMKKFGFTYNRIDFIGNHDNIRKYYNYVEAEVEIINAPISLIEKNRLKDKLKSIRFWNTDDINYYDNNYERWIDG